MTTTAVHDRRDTTVAGRFTLFFACCYFAEVVLGGPGSWSKDFLGVDVRKMLFGCVCLSLLYGVLRDGMLKLRDVIVVAAGLGLFVVWMLALPVAKGTEMAMSTADGIPIFSMFLVTVLFKIYSDHTDAERSLFYNRLTSFVLLMAGVTAVVHLALFAALNIWPDLGFGLLVGLKLVFDNQEAGSIYVGPMPDGSIRVFWISSLFLVYGLYRALSNLRVRSTARAWMHLLLFVGAILVTQTRSIFVAVPIAFCLAAMYYGWICYSRVSLFTLVLSLAGVLFIITFVQLTLASTDIMSMIGLGRAGSDEARGEQVGPLLQGWLEHLLLGGGFGFSVGYVRSEAAPYSYEFSILALYVKFGTIGLMLAWAYFIYMGISLARALQPVKKLCFEYAGLVFLIFVYFFVFNTNPYLSNSVGVAILMLLCIEAARLFKTPSSLPAAVEKVGK